MNMNTAINSESPRRETLVSQQPQIVINNVMPVVQPNNGALSTAEIDTAAKRLKITSWLLLLAGGYSTLACTGMLFNARKLSYLIITGEIKHGWHHKSTLNLPAELDRDEFGFYDIMRNVCIIAILFSMMVVGTGKKALHSIYQQKSDLTAKIFKCTICKIVIMALLFMYCQHISKEGHSMVASFRKRHNITSTDDFHHEIKSEDDEFCEQFSKGFRAEKKCDAQAKCTYCRSGAVGASCTSVVSAKTLPPSVFQCDDISEEDFVETEDTDFEARHKKRHHCCPFKVALFFIYIAHLWFLKKFHDSLKSYEDMGGKLEPKECCWSKKSAPAVPQQNLNYSMVSDNSDGITQFSAPPQTMPVAQNQMA